jgi:hypothetical protein
MIHIKAHTARAEVARHRAARKIGVAASKMVPAKNTWSWRLCFIEAYACGLSATELHRKMDEPWQNLIGLLGHLSREILDGQFFALIVRLVGNAMAQLIRDEQVVQFLRRRCSHVTAESERKRPVIPTEGGHPIRSKAASDSDRRRPPC